MITEIEISPSNRAICKFCGNKIGKETPRGIEKTSQNYGESKSYLCYKCTKFTLKVQIEYMKSLLKDLDEEIKNHSKEIIVMEL